MATDKKRDQAALGLLGQLAQDIELQISQLFVRNCDGDLSKTRAYFESQGLDADEMIAWLCETYRDVTINCDCQALTALMRLRVPCRIHINSEQARTGFVGQERVEVVSL